MAGVHRPVPPKGRDRARSICAECRVTWPCRERQEEIAKAARTCQQCGREGKLSPGRHRCPECVSAGQLLTDHWRKMGLYIRPKARRGARYAATQISAPL